MTPENYAEGLKAACGENLLAVVLYGSEAAGDALTGRSGSNVLVLLRDCGEAELKAVASASEAWDKAGNPQPVIFTREQLLSSGDVFPIELSDMKDFHRTLHGEDPLAGFAIAPEHLRLAVERELKGKLLRLRRSYLRLHGDHRAPELLLAGYAKEMLVLCRAALRLFRREVPRSKLECARELAKHFDFDAESFELADAVRRGGRAPGSPEELFGRFLKAAGRLAGAVDSWSPRR